MANVSIVGQGYRSLLQSAAFQVVDGIETESDSSTSYRFEVCTQESELHNVLDIDISAKASNWLASVQGTMKFAQQLTSSSHAVHIIVVAKQQSVKRLTSAKLNGQYDAPTLYSQGGDCFLNSITTGGKYIAVYTFSCTSIDSQKSVKASIDAALNGTGGVWTAELNASFKYEETAKASNSSVTFDQKIFGHKVDTPDKEHMVEFADKFTGLTLNAPEILDFELDEYHHVQGCPLDFEDYIKNCRKFNDDYKDWFGKSMMVGAAMNRITALYKWYNKASLLGEVNERNAGFIDTRSKIRKLAVTLDKDPLSKEAEWPDVSTKRYLLQIPRMSSKIVPGIIGGAWDPRDGNPFTEVTPSQLEAGIRIRSMKVEINEKEVVGSLQTSFEFLDGVPNGYTLNWGWGGKTTQVGNFDGKLYDQVQVWFHNVGGGEGKNNPSKIVLSIKDEVKDKHQIALGWNTQFDGKLENAPEFGFLIGWAGRSMALVDALQPLWAVIDKPTFEDIQ